MASTLNRRVDPVAVITPEPGYSAPSWDKRARQYAQCVGYHLRDGKRVRAFWRFGADPAMAKAAAMVRQQAWQQLVVLCRARGLKPYWGIDVALAREVLRQVEELEAELDASARARKQELARHEEQHRLAFINSQAQGHARSLEALEYVLGDLGRGGPAIVGQVAKAMSGHLDLVSRALAVLGLQVVTQTPTMAVTTGGGIKVGELRDAFIAAQRKRVGLQGGRGLKVVSFNGLVRMLNLALGSDCEAGVLPPIAPDTPLADVTRSRLEAFVDFWMSPRGLSARTAANYVRHLHALLIWAERQEAYGWVMPKGAGDAFKLRGVVGRSHVEDYSPAKILALLDGSPEMVQLSILMALNCGCYVQDLSDLTPADLVTHEGRPALWRGRSKTTHQNAFKVLHVLWPETVELLRKCQAPKNPHGRLLLMDGQLLQSEEVGGRASRPLAVAYERARRRTGVDLPHKQLRKTAYNCIKALAGRDVAEQFLGHAVPGVSGRSYDRADFGPLTAALDMLREKLKADGVF